MIVSAPVSGNASASAQQETTASATQNEADLGKSEFLTLLMAQIKNQDPLNPMENTDFTAQMAQFSSLEQLMSINNALTALQESAASSDNASAMMLIGKEVTAEGRSVEVSDGFASDIAFELPDAASGAVVKIENEYGEVVREIELGSLSPGEHKIQWNGKDDMGIPLENGTYTYSVVAQDPYGDQMEVSTYSKGKVTGVSFEDGVAYIHVGDMKFTLEEILEVHEVPASSTGGSGDSTSSSWVA